MTPWQLLHRPSTTNDGHLLFRDPHGQVSICDWSGHTPDYTDDGPLIVEPNTVGTVMYRKPYGFIFSVPVKVPRDKREGQVWLNAETAGALATHVPMTWRVSESATLAINEAQLASSLPRSTPEE